MSGVSKKGSEHPKISERIEKIKISDFAFNPSPTVFWDLDGQKGHNIRTTISEMGPLLLTRLLGLNDTQHGVLQIAFSLSDEQGLILNDLKDLKSVLLLMEEHSKALSKAVSYTHLTLPTICSV